MHLPQTLLEIVQAGGGLILDLSQQTYLPQTLIDLAGAASISGATLTMRVAGTLILPQTMLQISMAGRGRVIFEL